MRKQSVTNASQMRWILVLGLALGSLACFAAPHGSIAGSAETRPKLWAAITADRPVLELDTHKPIAFTFVVVNDSDSIVNPEIGRARLVVNDQEWPGSGMMFGNGPRDDRFERLPAGDYLLLSYSIPELFTEPGTYRVRWRGPGYESDPVTLRVLPQRLSAP